MRQPSTADHPSIQDEPVDDERQQCPHCRRRFNADPFDRHVAICPRNKNRVKLKL
jgi:hypothetical protein